jgi:DNA-binding NarL/FixJ family response regulator
VCEVKSQVYLLAENRLFREALTRILNKKSDIKVVGAGALSSDAETKIAECKPDILLADATALSTSELRVLPNLRKALPSLKIVMIGMDCEHETFLHAVREGAQGYVLKEASALEVSAAVRSVINHEAVCPPRLLSILFESVAKSQEGHPSAHVQRQLGLSRREQQLIQMISEGLTNKEIASRLGLSQQTIKNHVHRMLRKVGATDRLTIVERWREVRRLHTTQHLAPVWTREARSQSLG